ncbi:hypothetical protein [Fictibacillus fluitans]|uniref:Rad50/SbcC-type AAA domain-containing protein n=1 Tax=Fictibacillus fluitans TaxID=3058422 RepID=A0ABT8I080_9BACL|nr:hypothetical protein [Fictibacillus sp. NE201]MDN4526401.1 hypothetical protein [Fictibacillus sp. NE201]
MIINHIIIYDYMEKRINKFDFKPNANIIVSEENTIGKSSLIKSIYHCLGYSIKIWPSNWKTNNMVFQMEIKNGDRVHLITRHKNLFYVDDAKEILSEKEFSMWLQKFLNIFIKIKDKKTKKLSDIYASEVLLPFYIDQDKSWNGYVYSKSSDSFSRYNNVVKNIFDIYFQISNKKLLELQIQKSEYEMEISDIKKQIFALTLLEKEHSELLRPISKPTSNINFEANGNDPNEKINKYLKQINSYNKEVFKYDSEIIQIETQMDEVRREVKELVKLKRSYEGKFKEIKFTCIHCNSKLTQEQSITRLKIRNNQYEILENISYCNKKLDELESLKLIKEIERKNRVDKISEWENIMMESKNYEELDSYIEDRVNHEIINQYISVEQHLYGEENKKTADIKTINKEMYKERKSVSEKRAQVKKRYEELTNKYERYFNDIDLNEIGLYNFKEISGSGMDANKKMLALYTVYSNLVNEFSNYKVPFAMDSFIKNETSGKLKAQMFGFLSKYYLSIEGQMFFSIIKENIIFLDRDNDYHFIKLEKPILEEVNDTNKKWVKAFEIIDTLN